MFSCSSSLCTRACWSYWTPWDNSVLLLISPLPNSRTLFLFLLPSVCPLLLSSLHGRRGKYRGQPHGKQRVSFHCYSTICCPVQITLFRSLIGQLWSIISIQMTNTFIKLVCKHISWVFFILAFCIVDNVKCVWWSLFQSPVGIQFMLENMDELKHFGGVTHIHCLWMTLIRLRLASCKRILIAWYSSFNLRMTPIT